MRKNSSVLVSEGARATSSPPSVGGGRHVLTWARARASTHRLHASEPLTLEAQRPLTYTAATNVFLSSISQSLPLRPESGVIGESSCLRGQTLRPRWSRLRLPSGLPIHFALDNSQGHAFVQS